MSDTNMEKLLIALINKLIGYPKINNMGVELVLNHTTISQNTIFIASYEDLLEDIQAYTTYFKGIKHFDLILSDESDGLFWYKSSISFFIENDDIRVRYKFRSAHYNIISNEKVTTSMERLLGINDYYKQQNIKKVDLEYN